MSFRQGNHHDAWVGFRDASRQDFVRTGLPESIWARESRLKRFLESGNVAGDAAEIQLLSNAQFRQLARLVFSFYPDIQHHYGFLAFHREGARRGLWAKPPTTP